ncbi:hypothetical protein JOD69_001674 [Methylocaldum sp. RMAD-M]|nr:hypothetical protein [Methylocaldum sp. RMAD-M]
MVIRIKPFEAAECISQSLLKRRALLLGQAKPARPTSSARAALRTVRHDAAHHRQDSSEQVSGPIEPAAAVGGISQDGLDPVDWRRQSTQDQVMNPNSILNPGRNHSIRQYQGIDRDRPVAAFHPLAGVVTCDSLFFALSWQTAFSILCFLSRSACVGRLFQIAFNQALIFVGWVRPRGRNPPSDLESVGYAPLTHPT